MAELRHGALLLLGLLPSCAASGIPEGEGLGIVAVDREPPKGVRLYPKPVWTPGDRFVYRRGGRVRVEFRVVAVEEDRRVLEEVGSGLVLVLDGELRELGRGVGEEFRYLRRMDPFDARFSWPLWVGKKWACDFLDKNPEGGIRRLRADYECEGKERIVTAAGVFECLRILRRASLLVPGRDYYEQVSILWYAPDVGWFVRRLEEGLMIELEAYQRQRRTLRSGAERDANPPGPASNVGGRSSRGLPENRSTS